MASPKKSQSFESREHEALVLNVLERIAAILLRIGFDAPNTEYLLRCAFVLASLRRAELSGTRTTQSQIALVAGVNRLDVRRIVTARRQQNFAREIDRQSRLERILRGWKQDSNFVDARGRPKPLSIAGRSSEFARLARTYGRDVTPRTLMNMLVSNNVAAIKGRKLVLSENNSSKRASLLAGASDLNFLSSQLATYDFQSGRRTFVMRQRRLSVNDSKSLKLLQRKALRNIEAAIGSLDSVAVRDGQSLRVKKVPKHRLLVTTILSSETGIDELN
jgi:hypothetical protein